MLGSPHDAEDALQDTLLRAWRALPSFRGGSQLHTWLHRIATNVCLDAIANRHKRALPLDLGTMTNPREGRPRKPALHAPQIQPYQEGTVGSPDAAVPPEARYEQREALELAFIAALRHLPARQRSALILRDVLGFSAREAADALATTVPSVNGALLRARRAAEERVPGASRHPSLRTIGDRRLRETAERFADAFERGEIEAVLALLARGQPPREESCGNSPTSSSRPASRWRRSSRVCRTSSPTSGGSGRRALSERATAEPTKLATPPRLA